MDMLNIEKPIEMKNGWRLNWDGYGYLLEETKVAQKGEREGNVYVRQTYFYPTFEALCIGYMKKAGAEAKTLEEMAELWKDCVKSIEQIAAKLKKA